MSEHDDNILNSIKKQLGINAEISEFDSDIRTLINSCFFSLYQVGVGPSSPFHISENTEWNEYDTTIPKDVIQDYIFLKTKLIFDPPSVSAVIDAYKDRINELEFRMNIEVDTGGGVIL